MIYVFFSYDGISSSVAYKLSQEGNKVYFCQIKNYEDLDIEHGYICKETKFEQEQRMSIYDGLLEKTPLNKMLSILEKVEEKDNYFFYFDYNAMYNLADKVSAMGFKNGLFPTEKFCELESDRGNAKKFVEKYYPKVKVAKSYTFTTIADAIEFISKSNGQFALKSNGNFCPTVVSSTQNEEFARNELIYQLYKNKEKYEKGSFILEEKIINPLEIVPQAVFYNGELVYQIISMETRLIGAGEIGFQTGGSQNCLIRISPDDNISKLAFPSIVYEMAKKQKGMFIFDISLLIDSKTNDIYFGEYSPMRHGISDFFAEMCMSRDNEKVCSNYFESIVNKVPPQRYKYGTYVNLYNLVPDSEYATFFKSGLPLQWSKSIDSYFFPYQIKAVDVDSRDNFELIVNTGYANEMLACATGCGNTFKEAVDCLYQFTDKISFNGVVYRDKEDFLSKKYPTSIPNRIDYLEKTKLIGKPVKLHQDIVKNKIIMESYVNTISRTTRT